MDKHWLPTGNHWGLVIDHDPQNTGGDFLGAPWRMVLHTTEGADFATMARVLDVEGYEPHFLIKPSAGPSRVRQYFPLNRSARALEHRSGTIDTNRMNAVQIEIAGYAADAAHWQDWFYRDLAALCALIEHRVNIAHHRPPVTAPAFPGHGRVNHMTDDQWRRFSGYCGHCNVPGNYHWDPGQIDLGKLFTSIDTVTKQYQ